MTTEDKALRFYGAAVAALKAEAGKSDLSIHGTARYMKAFRRVIRARARLENARDGQQKQQRKVG